MTTGTDWHPPRPPVLHHLALGARDVEAVAAFYATVFGLSELQRHYEDEGALRSVWLDLDGAVLMIEHTKRIRQTVDSVDAGLFLIAFRVDSASRANLENRLANLGHPIETRTEHTSYFRDPESNRFAISSYPLENQE
jgi:catechol-2,3-dioxygenase